MFSFSFYYFACIIPISWLYRINRQAEKEEVLSFFCERQSEKVKNMYLASTKSGTVSLEGLRQ